MGGYATTAVKTPYHAIKDEIYLWYLFMKDNADAYMLPIPIFTTASLLCRAAERDEIISSLTDSFIYAFLYGYNIDIANNIAGGIEDRINKPDRPLASNATTLAATKVRYVISTVIYFAYSYKLDVLIWTLLWLFTISCAYFLRTSRYGLAKDLSMAVGTMAELMAAWKIGGSASEVGWTWVRKIVCWVFFTVSIQDYRDVPGDRASGRRTIPILFGDIPARIYNSTGLLMFQYILIHDQVLEFRHDISTVAMSIILAIMTAIVVSRLVLLRFTESDKITYRLYILLYNLQLAAACVSLRK